MGIFHFNTCQKTFKINNTILVQLKKLRLNNLSKDIYRPWQNRIETQLFLNFFSMPSYYTASCDYLKSPV